MIDQLYQNVVDKADVDPGGSSSTPTSDGQSGIVDIGVVPSPPTGLGPTVTLAIGHVVRTEIRDSAGKPTEYTHEYPIEPSGNVRIPDMKPIPAQGKTLIQLGDLVKAAILAAKLYEIITVNTTLSSMMIDYTVPIATDDKLFLRILFHGNVDVASGTYVVDASGSINIPVIGLIKVNGRMLVDVQSDIEQGLASNKHLYGTVVHITRTPLT
jgi:protein involved in polysaccharide export with SLBB domain